MRGSHRLRILAALILAGGGIAITTAAGSAADTPPTIYVDSNAGCRDTGSGTAASPFCTIQAAADIVVPGQTVQISASNAAGQLKHYPPVTIQRSGTPAAPITFVGVPFAGANNIGWNGPFAVIQATDALTTAGITITGAHDVKLVRLAPMYWGQRDGIDVLGSHDVTLDSMADTQANQTGAPNSANLFIDGASSNVTVTHVNFTQSWGYSIHVAPGASGITASGNIMSSTVDAPLYIDGASNVVVTGNSVRADCTAGIVITGASSATLENNVVNNLCTAGTSTDGAISVSAGAAATTTADYNAVFAQAPATEYTWAGTADANAAALTAATGQGVHDIDLPKYTWGPNLEGSPLIDSADSQAPGEPSTDINGVARADDPLDPNTGVGVDDRGVFENTDLNGYGASATPILGEAPVTSTFTIPVLAGVTTWGHAYTESLDFGDGSPKVTPTTTTLTHTYKTGGLYVATLTTTFAGGVTAVRHVTITVTPYPALAPVMIPSLGTITDANGVEPLGGDVSVSIPPPPYAAVLQGRIWYTGESDLTVGLAPTWDYEYTHPGIFLSQLVEQIPPQGGTFGSDMTLVAGDVYQALTPVRDYDSRQTAVKIPAGGEFSLTAAQLHITGSNVDAAQFAVTVLNATKSGTLSIDPGTVGSVSAVGFVSGQPATNLVEATMNQGGFLQFSNTSSGPIDLVVDTVGQYVRNVGGSTYTHVAPVRVLDSRNGTGVKKAKIAANGSVTLTVAGTHGVPANATAAIVNLLTTNTTASGELIAYAGGATRPATWSAAWGAKATVQNLAVVPLSGGKITLYNASSASVDLVADLVGYESPSVTGSVYVPVSAKTLADTVHGIGTKVAKLGAGASLTIPVGFDSPQGTTSAVVNVSALNGTASGTLTIYATGKTRPSLPTLTYASAHPVANVAITPLGTKGAITIYNGGTKPVDIVVQLDGTYFAYNS